MMNKLKLIWSILLAKRVHIVDYDGFMLCKIGSKDKDDKGVSRISSLSKNNG